MEDVVENIDTGMSALQDSFANIIGQLDELKHYEIGPKDAYNILGELFFKREVITINQISIIKKELEISKNFRHLGDKDFTAFDLYNHITESLKVSHPLNYLHAHIVTHKLFENVFSL